MPLQNLIFEIKKSGVYSKKDDYAKFINAMRKNKQLRTKLLNLIDPRLNENLSIKEIGLLL